jgi:hypothetical protein
MIEAQQNYFEKESYTALPSLLNLKRPLEAKLPGKQ